jgi:hypothetical protein
MFVAYSRWVESSLRLGGMIEIKWWHVTRTIGVIVFLYGVFIDDSPERGTIIMAGAGFAGFDRVARAETPRNKKNTDERQEVK